MPYKTSGAPRPTFDRMMRHHPASSPSGQPRRRGPATPDRPRPPAPPARAAGPGGEADALAHAALLADVRARLGPVCAHLTREQFDTLADAVTAFKERWDLFDREPP